MLWVRDIQIYNFEWLVVRLQETVQGNFSISQEYQFLIFLGTGQLTEWIYQDSKYLTDMSLSLSVMDIHPSKFLSPVIW